jgi:hypothetical protein
MLKPELLPGVGKVQGYRDSYLFRCDLGAEVEFITVMLWDSIDVVRAVAGPDFESAVVPETAQIPNKVRYQIDPLRDSIDAGPARLTPVAPRPGRLHLRSASLAGSSSIILSRTSFSLRHRKSAM